MKDRRVLWAPWRMEYLGGQKGGGEEECIFCTMPAQKDDEANLIVYRGARSYIIMNRFPYNSAHLLVVPYDHRAALDDLDSEAFQDLSHTVLRGIAILKKACRPQGVNVGLNMGRAAGAGIEQHVHWHIVPRWTGDTNFMPVIAETKVMPEHLLTTYRKLKAVQDAGA